MSEHFLRIIHSLDQVRMMKGVIKAHLLLRLPIATAVPLLGELNLVSFSFGT